MRLLVFEVNGVISTGVTQRLRERAALLSALQQRKIRATEATVDATITEMREAHADDVVACALWQHFAQHAGKAGWDQRRRAEEWRLAYDAYRGLAGFSFNEQLGIRQLLEDLKFNTVDSHGHVPLLAAYAHGGNMVRDALEHARLDRLLDSIVLSDDRGLRSSDPRLLGGLLEEFGIGPERVIMIGAHQAAAIAPAASLGTVTVHYRGDADWAMTPRGPWEEPDLRAESIGQLGDLIHHWINAPVKPPPASRRQQALRRGSQTY